MCHHPVEHLVPRPRPKWDTKAVPCGGDMNAKWSASVFAPGVKLDAAMGFINVLRGLRCSYALSQLDLPLSDITKFVRLAALLKRDILQPQPLPQSSPEKPPKHLPQSVTCFLADALGVSREVSERCWKVLEHDVWAAETHDKVNC
ncbi:hypothetical protein C8J56DRAFT_1094357 [Mycena floridula]|nr:hypothetical protein C8J56DRAFT_1094357 [Mycena floridula]